MNINELYDTKDNHFICLLNKYIDLVLSNDKKYKHQIIDYNYERDYILYYKIFCKNIIF